MNRDGYQLIQSLCWQLVLAGLRTGFGLSQQSYFVTEDSGLIIPTILQCLQKYGFVGSFAAVAAVLMLYATLALIVANSKPEIPFIDL